MKTPLKTGKLPTLAVSHRSTQLDGSVPTACSSNAVEEALIHAQQAATQRLQQPIHKLSKPSQAERGHPTLGRTGYPAPQTAPTQTCASSLRCPSEMLRKTAAVLSTQLRPWGCVHPPTRRRPSPT